MFFRLYFCDGVVNEACTKSLTFLGPAVGGRVNLIFVAKKKTTLSLPPSDSIVFRVHVPHKPKLGQHFALQIGGNSASTSRHDGRDQRRPSRRAPHRHGGR
jgi:hypothetical protein